MKEEYALGCRIGKGSKGLKVIGTVFNIRHPPLPKLLIPFLVIPMVDFFRKRR